MVMLCENSWGQTNGRCYACKEKNVVPSVFGVLHIFHTFGISLRYSELVRCDGVPKLFHLGCEPVALQQLQRHALRRRFNRYVPAWLVKVVFSLSPSATGI